MLLIVCIPFSSQTGWCVWPLCKILVSCDHSTLPVIILMMFGKLQILVLFIVLSLLATLLNSLLSIYFFDSETPRHNQSLQFLNCNRWVTYFFNPLLDLPSVSSGLTVLWLFPYVDG